MTPEQRRAARERCEKATAGPWSACTGSGRCECTAVRSDARAGIICDLLPDYELNRDSHKPILDDLRFIESARTDLPAALKQMDDDEGLMEQALAVVEIGLRYQRATSRIGEVCGAEEDAQGRANSVQIRAHGTRLRAVLDALRVRLGEAAQGEEASDGEA